MTRSTGPAAVSSERCFGRRPRWTGDIDQDCGGSSLAAAAHLGGVGEVEGGREVFEGLNGIDREMHIVLDRVHPEFVCVAGDTLRGGGVPAALDVLTARPAAVCVRARASGEPFSPDESPVVTGDRDYWSASDRRSVAGAWARAAAAQGSGRERGGA